MKLVKILVELCKLFLFQWRNCCDPFTLERMFSPIRLGGGSLVSFPFGDCGKILYFFLFLKF